MIQVIISIVVASIAASATAYWTAETCRLRRRVKILETTTTTLGYHLFFIVHRVKRLEGNDANKMGFPDAD